MFGGAGMSESARALASLRARQYSLSAFACLAASLINPYTYHLHTHMVMYLRDPFNSQHIHEFLSPSFHHPSAIFFELMLVLAALAACRSLSKGKFTDAIFLLLWAHGALLAARNIPIFLIVASLPVAAVLQEGLERLPRWDVAAWLEGGRSEVQSRGHRDRGDRFGRPVSPGERAGHGVGSGRDDGAPTRPRISGQSSIRRLIRTRRLPTLRSDPAAHIFTQDEWGDYLIWKLYPSQKVFVDGRSDFYGDDFEEKYIDILNVNDGWEKTLAQFGVDTILMPPNTPLTGALKVSSHWRVVYDDGISVVFFASGEDRGPTVFRGLKGQWSQP